MAEYIDREKIQYREIVDYYDEQNMCEYHCDVADKVKIDRLPIADVIPIPEGATNGDVIKAMFPNCEQKENIHNGYFEMYFDGDFGNPSYMRVRECWWNAKYKKEVEE